MEYFEISGWHDDSVKIEVWLDEKHFPERSGLSSSWQPVYLHVRRRRWYDWQSYLKRFPVFQALTVSWNRKRDGSSDSDSVGIGYISTWQSFFVLSPYIVVNQQCMVIKSPLSPQNGLSVFPAGGGWSESAMMQNDAPLESLQEGENIWCFT